MGDREPPARDRRPRASSRPTMSSESCPELTMLLPAGRPNTNAPSALLSPLDTSASVALRLDNERHAAEAAGLFVAAKKKEARRWVSSSEPTMSAGFLGFEDSRHYAAAVNSR